MSPAAAGLPATAVLAPDSWLLARRNELPRPSLRPVWAAGGQTKPDTCPGSRGLSGAPPKVQTSQRRQVRPWMVPPQPRSPSWVSPCTSTWHSGFHGISLSSNGQWLTNPIDPGPPRLRMSHRQNTTPGSSPRGSHTIIPCDGLSPKELEAISSSFSRQRRPRGTGS